MEGLDLQLLLVKGPVSRSNGIDDLLVHGPQGIPLQRDDVLRWALRDHELPECLDSQTTATDAAHGRKARIIPAADVTFVDEPMELALREKGVDEVETTMITT